MQFRPQVRPDEHGARPLQHRLRERAGVGDEQNVPFAVRRDSGAFPEPVLERARAILARAAIRTELHVHVLAQSPGERAALIEDLSARL